MAKTVLDLIPVSEIEKWQAGDHVLVIAGTGKCKTTWVKQVLWPYCKERGMSLFTLANRSMLRDDIRHGSDMPVLTYQLLEQKADHPAWNANVIVMDECHSLATDILLDYRRNMMLRFFQNKHTIIVGLTATPVDCVTELFDQKHIYIIPRDVEHIKSVQTYRNVNQTASILREEMRRGGRVLCFVRSAKRGRDIHYAVRGSAFVCSRNAEQWTPMIEAHKKAISRDRHWGNPQALIATKVMDVGVSIEDPDVTTVIVETEDYTVDLIQMIGRIRCQKGQRIRLFICILPEVYFQKKLERLKENVDLMETHLADPTEHMYNEHAFPKILMNGQVNEMMLRYYRQLVSDAEEILRLGAESVLSRQLCGLVSAEHREMKHPQRETHAQREQMADELREMIVPLVGKEYEDKQELFDIFDGLIQIDRDALAMPAVRLTRKSINEVLDKLDLPFQIEHRQYTSGPRRGKYYCRLTERVLTG